MPSKFLFDEIVLQPTSLCNLNCNYCYLIDRQKNRRMRPEVTVEIARTIQNLPLTAQPIKILWHCGEPLACGYAHFNRLIAPFAELEQAGRVQHVIQTNGTLVDQLWCEFFLAHRFQVGVSLDGPAWANHNRVDWKGSASFSKILRGIETMRAAGIPLNLMAVVSEDSLDKAAELYQFFADLGCQGLSINIEERTGVNDQRDMIDNAVQVRQFWTDLHAAWKNNPVLIIRELDLFFNWWGESEEKELTSRQVDYYRTNLFPTVGWNGDVVFLSPELLDTATDYYHNFVVGNLCQEPLLEIIRRSKKTNYVLDFVSSHDACKQTCDYYSFCGGGYASSKFFELGTTAGTETAFCRNSRIRLFDALSTVLIETEKPGAQFSEAASRSLRPLPVPVL